MNKRAAAVFDVFLDRIDFGLLIIASRATDDQSRAIAGTSAFCSRLMDLAW